LRVRRLLAAVITVGLVAPAAAIVSTAGTSASAAVATSIVASDPSRPLIYGSSNTVFGDNLYTSNIDIVGADGSSPYGGTTTLQRQLAGESTWTTISTTSGAYVSSTGLKAEGNALYRITWSGSGNWTGSSADVTVAVARDIDIDGISGKRAGFKGKIKPGEKVKIKVTKKVGKKYKKYKTFKSNKKGKFSFFLPAPRSGRFNWKMSFSGSTRFVGSSIKGYTY